MGEGFGLLGAFHAQQTFSVYIMKKTTTTKKDYHKQMHLFKPTFSSKPKRLPKKRRKLNQQERLTVARNKMTTLAAE